MDFGIDRDQPIDFGIIEWRDAHDDRSCANSLGMSLHEAEEVRGATAAGLEVHAIQPDDIEDRGEIVGVFAKTPTRAAESTRRAQGARS